MLHVGSCWAFATVATVESLNKIIKGGELLDLSEQEVLDCDVAGQLGCSGGYIDKALLWIQAQGGVVTVPGTEGPVQDHRQRRSEERRVGKEC